MHRMHALYKCVDDVCAYVHVYPIQLELIAKQKSKFTSQHSIYPHIVLSICISRYQYLPSHLYKCGSSFTVFFNAVCKQKCKSIINLLIMVTIVFM